MNKHRWLDKERRCSCDWESIEKMSLDVSTQWSLHSAEMHFHDRGYGHAENYFEDKVLRAYRECAEMLKQFNEKLREKHER